MAGNLNPRIDLSIVIAALLLPLFHLMARKSTCWFLGLSVCQSFRRPSICQLVPLSVHLSVVRQLVSPALRGCVIANRQKFRVASEEKKVDVQLS